MNSVIATWVRGSLDGFRLLCTALELDFDPVGDMTVPRVKDELARFKVWAGNIGAARTGRSSLEYRLRDSSNIRKQVLKLLEDLVELLQDAHSILKGDPIQLEDHNQGAEWREIMDGVEMFYNAEADADSLDLEDVNTNRETELSQIFTDIKEVVDCLFRLSVSIRNPAPHDRFRQSTKTDTSHHEPFDILHVREKFPVSDEVVAKRLGRAISLRRQYFKYRELHRQKLGHGLDDDDTSKMDEAGISTIASSVPKHLKEGESANEQTTQTVLDDDQSSEAGLSQTSFASSSTAGKRRVPPLPEQAEKGPFECPFCYMIISATTTRTWKHHVFGDLRPYVCLSPSCPTPGQDFERRHHWIQHVLQHHWRTWSCSFGCIQNFQSDQSIKDHLTTTHSNAIDEARLDTLVQLSERPKPLDAASTCPLCLQSLSSVKEYQRHVGRHQEELALFALPNIEGGEDDGSEESDESKVSEDIEEPEVLKEQEQEMTSEVC
ncbi:hypothetical protein B0H66DRAFT_482065 [Apodospora peruviana]|uniref:C2H2-type domain-containing protein n=1 Tax=Apodospora peruviana TaxID=516989 RepID=A0AAE0HYJ4_9PEZI|nr:hypothetical protein B0H66DRAFT_482065 [Apodospora peruviana]